MMSEIPVLQAQTTTQETLYPWTGKTGLLGYCNENGEIKISPRYESASLFANQFAVVKENGKDGIIDKSGVLKAPCEYERIQLVATEGETLAITSRKYNGWWKINRWKLFPGFSIMGGNGDKRIFDTDVPMTTWEVLLPATGQILISTNHPQGEYPYQTQDISRYGDKLLINDQLFEIRQQQVKRIGSGYKGVLDQDLEIKDRSRYQYATQVILQIAQHPFTLAAERTVTGTQVKLDLIMDKQQQVYLYPDLSKAFPSHIAAYPDTQISAAAIIDQAQMISSVPGTPYFIIYSYLNSKFAFYLLHSDGSWETDFSKTGNFMVSSPSGNILYPSAAQLGVSAFIPKGTLLNRVEKVSGDKLLIAVEATRANTKQQLSGIFDMKDKKWILPLLYSSLMEMNQDKRIWRFEEEVQEDYKKRKYGLINMETGQVTVAPKYNILNPDGKAGIFTNTGLQEFYINIRTGREYKE